jgi:hypothetical protein
MSYIIVYIIHYVCIKLCIDFKFYKLLNLKKYSYVSFVLIYDLPYD